MRIIANYLGNGLRGIKPLADIPECHGMYGVNASGNAPIKDVLHSTLSSGELFDNMLLGAAQGGVKIGRPLLGFSKQRLIATCRHSSVPWIEDWTNEDKTLTLRNTVRYLLHGKLLPPALHKYFLLRLCERTKAKFEKRNSIVNSIFNSLRIKSLDIHAGKLVIQVPNLIPFIGYAEQPAVITKYERSMVVHRIACLVTPHEKIAMDQLSEIVQYVLPDVAGAAETTPISITAAGVKWHGSPSELRSQNSEWIWTLSRQPYKAKETRPQCIWSTDPTQDVFVDCNSSSQPFWTWQLFDGRFWIRARNASRQQIIARPLHEDDMKNFRAGLTKSVRARFEKILVISAPGKVRWTLPALVDGIHGPVIAVPTFGVQLTSTVGLLHWQIQYKRVDYSKLK